MIAFAHPITDNGKGELLESLISRLLGKEGNVYQKDIAIQKFKNGVSIVNKEFGFTWIDGAFRFWSFCEKNREVAFAKAIDSIKKMQEKIYDTRAISINENTYLSLL